MSNRDPLRFTYEDARQAQLRDGLRLSTSAKVAFFEEMVSFAARFGALRRVREDARGPQVLPSGEGTP